NTVLSSSLRLRSSSPRRCVPAAQLLSGAGATGTIYVTSYRKTLDLAMKLHPGTQHIFVVSGTMPSGESWERMARNDLQGFQAAITYLTDLPLDELTRRLEPYQSDPSFFTFGRCCGIAK